MESTCQPTFPCLLLLVLSSCGARADPFDAGSISLAGKTPEEWCVPKWRALVTYVHQVCVQQ